MIVTRFIVIVVDNFWALRLRAGKQVEYERDFGGVGYREWTELRSQVAAPRIPYTFFSSSSVSSYPESKRRRSERSRRKRTAVLVAHPVDRKLLCSA